MLRGDEFDIEYTELDTFRPDRIFVPMVIRLAGKTSKTTKTP